MKSIDYSSEKLTSQTARRQPGQPAYYGGHLLIGLGLLLLVLVAGWLTLQAVRFYTAYRIVNENLAALRSAAAAGPSDPASLEQQARDLAGGLVAMQQAADPFGPLLPYLGWLPGYGGDLQAAPTLLGLGSELGQTGLLVLDAWAAGPEPAGDQPLSRLVTILEPIGPDLAQARARLQARQAALSQLPVESLSPRTGRIVEQLNTYLPLLITGLELGSDLPALLGSEAPRTYLLLAPNADELRPAGGYITSAGHLTLDRGQIVDFVMQDSYAVDRLRDEYPYPPGPLYTYMQADYWVLRDAGWSPDFPTAARQAMALYELGQGIEAEGVISFDQYALAALLGGLGPVTVEGQEVTGQNVIQLMRQQWAPDAGQKLDSAWWQQRKSFMVSLGETVIHQLQTDLEPGQLPGLLAALTQANREKHLLIYLNRVSQTDPRLSQLAGALEPVQGDYLMVVDANLGFNKASAQVERRLHYQVTLAADGSAQIQAELVYRHQALKRRPDCAIEIRYDPVYEQNMQRCLWNYVQLLVPAGARLSQGPQEIIDGRYLLSGEATPGTIETTPVSPDKQSWGQLMLLRPESEKTLTYAYTLPAQTARPLPDGWQYRLFLQKQPGTLSPATLVSLTLPPGAVWLDSEPQPVSLSQNTATFELNQPTDQWLRVNYRLAR